MAENSQGQGEKPWIPPNLAAVLHGPVPKARLPSVEKMQHSRKLSSQQLQPRKYVEPRPIEEKQPRFWLPNSPSPKRSIQEMQTQTSFLGSLLRSRDFIEPMSIDKVQLTPRSVEEMEPQPRRSNSPLRRRNAMEPKSTGDVRPRSRSSNSPLRKRSIQEIRTRTKRSRSPSPLQRIGKKPRYIQEMQPQTSSLRSSLRPQNGMKSTSIDTILTPGEVSNVPKDSIQSVKTTFTTSTDNDSKKRKRVRKTFHKFSDFPLEIQIMIWQWYGRIHANSAPNIIKIFRSYRPVPQDLRVGTNQSQQYPGLALSYQLPPIFYVCKLTFKIAKDLYEKEFQVIPMIKDNEKLTYFNEDRDIIALENASVLRDWRYNRQTQSEFNRTTRIITNHPAGERITRRINMKHLVIGGTDRSRIEERILARFYDCESIMLGVPYLIRARFFSTEDRCKADREAISFLRDRLTTFWKEERQGPFVREDYREKPTRPVVVEPSWDPTERTISNPMFLVCTDQEIFSSLHHLHPAMTNFMTPLPGAESSITFMNEWKFSLKHARLFEYPWEYVQKKD
ncbi:hypothetical protein EAE96_009350 [Botrytis aclada]|nr:hypothetical protein EAE96_009350 [Botrytis aclada]